MQKINMHETLREGAAPDFGVIPYKYNFYHTFVL